MEKRNHSWTLRELQSRFTTIDFPEFQREPTVWKLSKKQRLIDSILRDFDIAAVYLYRNPNNDTFDCIDGRQRINAIMSFIGSNEADLEDNHFHTLMTNEITNDEQRFEEINNRRFGSFPQPWQDRFWEYRINIVEIAQVEYEEELNLLFLRLQLGAVLNAGEKLHAMTGDMRNFVFYNLSQHNFFQSIRIPYRRFAREQVAAQIAINFYSKRLENNFHKARFVDLQDFFKERSHFEEQDRALTQEIISILTRIESHFNNNLRYISNRAVAVSVFLFANELISTHREHDLNSFIEFLLKFLKTLKWQIPKGINIDREYQDLLQFNNNITQAAIEKPAIERRNDILGHYFYHYQHSNGYIIGDEQYNDNHPGESADFNRAQINL